MLTLIQQVIDFFVQNPIISLLTGGYVLITFGNTKEREMFFERTWQIIKEPTAIEEYGKDGSWLRSVESTLKLVFFNELALKALQELNTFFIENIKVRWQKLIGWLFLWAMLIMFLIADLITIQSIAAVLGFPLTFELPGFFNDFGFAILAGTFFSIIASAFVMYEISGKSEFSEFAEMSDIQKKIIKVAAVFTIVSSLVVVIAFGLKAYAVTALQLSEEWAVSFQNAAQFSGNVLVRLNTFIITGIIANEAIKGFQSLVIFLTIPAILVLGIFYLVTDLITKLVRILLDLVYRTFLWTLWMLSFLLVKPLDTIALPFKALGRAILRWFGEETPAQDTVTVAPSRQPESQSSD